MVLCRPAKRDNAGCPVPLCLNLISVIIIHTLVDSAGSFSFEVAWSEDNVQTFTVEIGENATFAAKPADPVKPPVEEPPVEEEGPVNPPTGDLPAAALFALLALALACTGFVLVSKKAKAR